MRSFLAFLLLFSLMLPTISPWGTIAYFRLNRDYIARVLCENKKRPELKCNGKCYLAKVLKRQREQQDNEMADQIRNLPVLQLFSQSISRFKFYAGIFAESFKPRFRYQISGYLSPMSRFFRPPQTV